MDRPLIIAHRGASGERPEHTLAAYDLGIAQGADYIEPDVVSTRDGVLMARHENEIGGTTDVAAKFPDRRRSATVDGEEVSGWFVEDFTLAEMKTLRARERLPGRSRAHDGAFEVPTLDEVLALVRQRERESGRRIGVYPETKHPTHFRALGLPLEERLLDALSRHGFRTGADAVLIQSFEVGNLRALRQRTTIRLVQLADAAGAPYDRVLAGDPRPWRDRLTTDGLREVAAYAWGIGVARGLLPDAPIAGPEAARDDLVAAAHRAGLRVHVWTLRSDAPFLPARFAGDATAEWRFYADLGVDGMFGDFPRDGVRAFDGRRLPPPPDR